MAYEREIKQKIGFVFENMVFYESVSIEKMTDIIRPFYNQWDEKKYEKYIRLFDLDEKKKIRELSKGMRTKYALALALCRGAELLIMDEPTAGLDPVFRRELLDILQEIMWLPSLPYCWCRSRSTERARGSREPSFLNSSFAIRYFF